MDTGSARLARLLPTARFTNCLLLTALVTVPYALAIVTAVFRSFYRWYLSRFRWEDVWVVIALLLDIGCLTDVWLPRQSEGVFLPLYLV